MVYAYSTIKNPLILGTDFNSNTNNNFNPASGIWEEFCMNYHFPLSQKTMSGVLRNANHSCHDIFNRGSVTDEGKIFFGCMGISVIHFIVAPGPLKLLDIGPLEAEFMGTLVGLKIVDCPF